MLRLLMCVTFLLALVAPYRTEAQLYSIRDLGSLTGSSYTGATAINDFGLTVGQVTFTEPSESRAVLFSNGEVMDLGYRGLNVYAADINNAGQIIAVADGYGFLWQNGVSTPLSVTQRLLPADINDQGQVVGRFFDTTRAFLYQNGVVQDIHHLVSEGTGGSVAAGINNVGEIVGSYTNPMTNRGTPFLYNSTGLHNLGLLPGNYIGGGASDINERGQVVGSCYVTTSGPHRAFYYDVAGMHDLGALLGEIASFAYALNESGLIVGWGQKNGVDHAVLWRDGQIFDLNDLILPDSGWVLTACGGINERGEIVGSGQFNGQERAFLLTPMTARISGTVTLEDCADSIQPVTITLRHENTVVEERTVTLGADGSFTLADVPRQNYTLHIKGAKWLAANVAANAADGDVSGVTAFLKAGDADNSNLVDVDDLSVLIASFDADPTSPNWLGGAADFDCNNIVDVDDLSLLIRNFDTEGDL